MMLKATVLPILMRLMSVVKRKEKMMLLTGRWRRGWTCGQLVCCRDWTARDVYVCEEATEWKALIAGEGEELS